MLAKLLALLLQSKGAAISAVFVLGTTGALVSATTQNGVTTVTITPATESASSSPADASKETDNDKDEHSSTSKTETTTPSSCSTEAQAANAAVRQIDSTAIQFKLSLDKLARDKGEKGRQAAQTAGVQLMQTRRDAVKAIHALATTACADDDEDTNDTADEDTTDSQNTGSNKDENDDKDSTTTTTGVTFTGTTPQAIADEATAAMTLTFNTAKATISALPTVTSKDAQTRATDQKSTAKKGGAGESGRGHD